MGWRVGERGLPGGQPIVPNQATHEDLHPGNSSCTKQLCSDFQRRHALAAEKGEKSIFF